MRNYLVVIIALLIPTTAYTTTWRVPSQYPTVQAGINIAQDGDSVLVAVGTYTGTGNKNIDFFGKTIVVTSEMGAETCIIDCQNNGRGFYFHTDEDSMSVLSGFTIINGYCEEYGGGIYFANSSAPRINNCGIINCYASGGGGGIAFNQEYWVLPKIESCIVQANTAVYGGGLYIHASNPIIINCTIRDNQAIYDGGGIYANVTGGTLSYCKVFNNRAEGGGGICFDFDAQMITSHCIIRNNEASYGGGIIAGKSCLPLDYCSILDNTATLGCGGIHTGDPSILTSCLVIGNSTGGNGGGIGSNASLHLFNCTISRNSAAGYGGGIVSAAGTLDIQNSIVEANQGNGGIYISSVNPNLDITFSDFYRNYGGNFLGNVPPQLGQIVTTNLNGDSCDIFHNIFLDPLFLNPDSGGYHLTANSPCIDAGDPLSPFDPDSTIADMGVYFYDQRYVRPRLRANMDNLVGFHVGPNPFNPSTAISFKLQASSDVSLKVYDTAGRLVATLVDGWREAGRHEATFDGSGLAAGIYFVRIKTGEFTTIQKIVLLK